MAIVDIEAHLASIFAMAGTPDFPQAFLLRQKSPINTVDLFANVASSSGEMHTIATSPAGYGDGEVLPAEARLRCRGSVGVAWRLAEASIKNKKSPNDERSGISCWMLLSISIDGTECLRAFKTCMGLPSQFSISQAAARSQ